MQAERGDGPARLFLAVALPAELREALEAHLRAALPGGLPGRPVPPRNWHLTLRFLGDTPAPTRDALVREMERAPLGPPFPIRFGGCGAFPRESRATVLWLGLAGGAPELGRLAAAVEAAAGRAGFPADTRPFAAHLTLSRLHPARDVRELLASIPPFARELPVREVTLHRSRLGQGAPRYEPVTVFPLG